MTTGTTKAADRFVRVGNLNLHYLEWGEAGAPLVIMVHGLSGNAHAFDNLAPNFVPRYHVISVDVLGRGDSYWAADANYSNDAYVADLEGAETGFGFRAHVAVRHLPGWPHLPELRRDLPRSGGAHGAERYRPRD